LVIVQVMDEGLLFLDDDEDATEEKIHGRFILHFQSKPLEDEFQEKYYCESIGLVKLRMPLTALGVIAFMTYKAINDGGARDFVRMAIALSLVVCYPIVLMGGKKGEKRRWCRKHPRSMCMEIGLGLYVFLVALTIIQINEDDHNGMPLMLCMSATVSSLFLMSMHAAMLIYLTTFLLFVVGALSFDVYGMKMPFLTIVLLLSNCIFALSARTREIDFRKSFLAEKVSVQSQAK